MNMEKNPRQFWFLMLSFLLVVITSVFLWRSMQQARSSSQNLGLIKLFEDNAEQVPSIEDLKLALNLEILQWMSEVKPAPPPQPLHHSPAEIEARWKRFHALDEAQKAQLTESFAYFRSFKKAEQEELRQNLVKFNQLSQEDRQKIHKSFEKWQKLSEEEKKELKSSLLKIRKAQDI